MMLCGLHLGWSPNTHTTLPPASSHPRKWDTKKCDPSSNLHNKMGHTYSFRTFLSNCWTRLSLLKPNHVLSVCKPVSRLLVKRILLVEVIWVGWVISTAMTINHGNWTVVWLKSLMLHIRPGEIFWNCQTPHLILGQKVSGNQFGRHLGISFKSQ